MKTKTIEHKVLFHAAPKDVYDALINGKKHSQFTGAPAKMRAKAGTPFSCYGDYITGVTLDLASGKRIVQAWRSQGWPVGHYSIVTFALSPKAGGKTHLYFTQTGVPANDFADKNKGWRTHYWEPLEKFLESR
jgi:activator of HSP90 ATPase